MSDLFYAIVQALNGLCRITGLSYTSLNILIYTGLVPASWWLILWVRTRAWPVAGCVHLGATGWYLANQGKLGELTSDFYDANTAALWWLGNSNDAGYIRVSILAGIVAPALLYFCLLYGPKPYLKAIYLSLLSLNAVWYGWVLSFF